MQLNPEQRSAIEHNEGPLLIIAGAGTGKTTVVTELVKWLITKKEVKPSEILALSFTDKAAREMEERVDVALPYGYGQLWISTFHSFGDRILRNEAIHIGLDTGYKLMTMVEAIMFMRKHLFAFNLDYFRPLGNPTKFVDALLQHFSRLKDEDISPSEYIRFAKTANLHGCDNLHKQSVGNSHNVNLQQQHVREESKKTLELAYAYQKYEELKEKNGVFDFPDLVSNTLKLFRKRPNVLNKYQDQFKYILVDEFQDTNYAQYALIKLLASPDKHSNLVVVGDDNQSVYRFRGAAISNILMFMEEYKGAKTVVLTKNYRSTQTILDHAYQVIKQNDPDTLETKLGINKQLTSMRFPNGGDLIEYIYADRVENEAEQVAQKIKCLLESESYFIHKRHDSLKPKDFAILVRANNHADPFVRALQRSGIPYQFLGPGQLFHRKEVKDLIAYLRFLANLEDSVSLYRVLAMECFVISPRDIAALTGFSKKINLSLFDAIEIIAASGNDDIVREDKDTYKESIPFISKATKEKITSILKMIYRHLALATKETAGQILYYFLEDTDILSTLATTKSIEQEKRAVNIASFFNKLKTYEVEHDDASIQAVVDWINTRMELGESPLASDMDWSENDAVTILTAHSAKGLEFPVVFIVNLVEGRFPTRKRREKLPIPEKLIKEILPSGDFHIQEERRLFYVCMTRAMDKLYLTSSLFYGEGKREQKISPFVYETIGEIQVEKAKKQKNINNPQLFLFDWKKGKKKLIKAVSFEDEPKKQSVTYLSYSQIETFLFCPLHYKARYILGLPTPIYAAQSFGQTIHLTLKRFYMGLMQTSSLKTDAYEHNQTQHWIKQQESSWDINKLLTIYDEAWIPLGYASKKHEVAMKRKGKEQLIAFYESFHDKEPLPSEVEQPFIFRINNQLKVGGVIDRIQRRNGKIEIIDYKTATKVPTQKQVDRNLQLTIYALAATIVKDPVMVNHPEEIVLSLYFLGSQKKISTKRTKKQLEEARKEIILIAKQIERSDFACSGVPWCKKCEFKILCNPK